MAPPKDRAVLMKAIMRNQGKAAGHAPIKQIHFNVPDGHPRTLVLAAGIVLKRGRKINFRAHYPPEPDQPEITVNSKTLGYTSQQLQFHFGNQNTNEEVALVAGLLLKSAPRLDLVNKRKCVTSIYVDEDDEEQNDLAASSAAVNNAEIQAAAAKATAAIAAILGEREAKLKAKSNLAKMGEEERKIGQLLREAEKE